MPCMEMFCFRLSTRLGSIIIGALTIDLIPLIAVASVGGTDGIREFARNTHEHIAEYDQQEIFMWLLQQMEMSPGDVNLYVMLFFGMHIFACAVMVIGAFRLMRYLLIPYIVLDFIRLCLLSLSHVTVMMVIKKQLNLGDLIAMAVAGGFVLLFYLWACVVSLFQIIGIVETEKYRNLFGTDTIEPHILLAPNKAEKDQTARMTPSNVTNTEYFTYNTDFTNEYFTNNQENYKH